MEKTQNYIKWVQLKLYSVISVLLKKNFFYNLIFNVPCFPFY